MRVLITAGPTREPIDAVRFISNRSSGSMGLALAQAAAEADHQVTLLLGPGPRHSDVPAAVRCLRFETCADLQRLLDEQFPSCDLLIMAAAVADYRPTRPQTGKLPRQEGQPMTLVLEPTPDLVAQLAGRRRPDQRLVAFALESPEQLPRRAGEKMQRKGVDAIVANPLNTMESPGIDATLLWRDGRELRPGPMDKLALARWLVEQVTTTGRPPSGLP